MFLGNIIKRIIAEEGLEYKERSRTIHTVCPQCGLSDKLSILKENGATICYRGRCQFKGFFDDWLAATANISIKEAKERIYQKPYLASKMTGELKLNWDNRTDKHAPKVPVLSMVSWPIYGALDIKNHKAREGAEYLMGRGIPIDIASYYQIQYVPATRRVIFPIFMNGTCYGWQGRAIDKVAEKDRIRNNTGFNRASLVMFLDQLQGRNYVIISEGPIDAIKFHRIGGNIATMGKVVTERQLQLIKKHNVQSVYLALDYDAAPEMRNIVQKFDVPVYRLIVPPSCCQRCQKKNIKADFGECSFEECIEAVKHAVLLDQGYLMTYLKDPKDVIRDAFSQRSK
jgi:hypothetical protein